MSVFYAYAITGNELDNRHLITFASRSVADEWWRAIQDSVTERDRTTFAEIKRVTPQLYASKNSWGTILNIVTDTRWTSHLVGKWFFTLLHDFGGGGLCDSLAPPIDITDHISGNCYYIRSKCEPNQYWHLTNQSLPEGAIFGPHQVIRLSATGRTRFRIDIRAANRLPQNGKIMIGSDDIIISALRIEDNDVVINDKWELVD
ncbi:hypothetical protein FPQ18DRAFT_393820 [Pyronema domesticum]|nr:hypothetical protein FPQ18DRAFT_393820 [Pyronema domesticum]